MNKPLLFTAIAAIAVLYSCNNTDFDGYKKAENGLHYRFFSHSDTDPVAQEGDGMICRYTIRKKSSSLIWAIAFSARPFISLKRATESSK